MKKFLVTLLKAAIFFIGWALCVGIGDIPSSEPAFWRLGAEALPLVYIAAFTLVFWLVEKRKIRVVSFQKPTLNIGVGLGAGTLWLGITIAVLCLTGNLSFTDANSVPYLAVWMLACFLNVIMQELLVRGYLYQLIRSNYSAAAAIIVTTALWTLMHAGAFEAGIVPVLNVITTNLLLSVVFEYTGSILAPILMHSIWNEVGALLLGCDSLAEDYPHLLNAVLGENTLISGGSYQIAGSIVVLILNVLLTGTFLLLMRRKSPGQRPLTS